VQDVTASPQRSLKRWTRLVAWYSIRDGQMSDNAGCHRDMSLLNLIIVDDVKSNSEQTFRSLFPSVPLNQGLLSYRQTILDWLTVGRGFSSNNRWQVTGRW
jgi:hypothetical protein